MLYVGGAWVNSPNYADDMVLLAPTVTALHTLLYVCRAYAGPHDIVLLLKEVGSARLRERDKHHISPKTPAPQYQPIDRKKRKGKIV